MSTKTCSLAGLEGGGAGPMVEAKEYNLWLENWEKESEQEPASMLTLMPPFSRAAHYSP